MPAPVRVILVARLVQLLLLLRLAFLQFRLAPSLALLWFLWSVPAVRAFRQDIAWVAGLLRQPRMPPRRCCTRIQDEFRPSYASVLVYGKDPAALEQAVRDAETKQRLTSCFTAWCPACYEPYLLTTDLENFPSPSAHHTHQLVLMSVLRESGALFPAERV